MYISLGKASFAFDRVFGADQPQELYNNNDNNDNNGNTFISNSID